MDQLPFHPQQQPDFDSVSMRLRSHTARADFREDGQEEEGNAVHEDNSLMVLGDNGGQPTSCKAATLSAWVSFLSCFMLMFLTVVSLLKSLFVNERFWQQTEQFIAGYIDSRLCDKQDHENNDVDND